MCLEPQTTKMQEIIDFLDALLGATNANQVHDLVVNHGEDILDCAKEQLSYIQSIPTDADRNPIDFSKTYEDVEAVAGETVAIPKVAMFCHGVDENPVHGQFITADRCVPATT